MQINGIEVEVSPDVLAEFRHTRSLTPFTHALAQNANAPATTRSGVTVRSSQTLFTNADTTTGKSKTVTLVVTGEYNQRGELVAAKIDLR